MSDDILDWLVARLYAEPRYPTVPLERLREAADAIAELRKALQLIAQLDGQTLLGPSDLDFDHLTKRVPDQCWAHEVGAARAFNQAAAIAKEALKVKL